MIFLCLMWPIIMYEIVSKMKEKSGYVNYSELVF